jgi:hypothetical protein
LYLLRESYFKMYSLLSSLKTQGAIDLYEFNYLGDWARNLFLNWELDKKDSSDVQ